MSYFSNAPEIKIEVSGKFSKVTVEVFDLTPEQGDSAYPTKITLQHDGQQISLHPRECPENGVTFYVVGSWEAGDLEEMFLNAAKAIKATGIPQAKRGDQ